MIFPPDYHWKTRKDRPAILAKADQLRQELGLPVKAHKPGKSRRKREPRTSAQTHTADLFDCPRDAAERGKHAKPSGR